MIEENILDKHVDVKQIKYLNNIVEQEHRFIKNKVKYPLGFKSFETVVKTIEGIEEMNMLRKGQVNFVNNSALLEVKFIK